MLAHGVETGPGNPRTQGVFNSKRTRGQGSSGCPLPPPPYLERLEAWEGGEVRPVNDQNAHTQPSRAHTHTHTNLTPGWVSTYARAHKYHSTQRKSRKATSTPNEATRGKLEHTGVRHGQGNNRCALTNLQRLGGPTHRRVESTGRGQAATGTGAATTAYVHTHTTEQNKPAEGNTFTGPCGQQTQQGRPGAHSHMI